MISWLFFAVWHFFIVVGRLAKRVYFSRVYIETCFTSIHTKIKKIIHKEGGYAIQAEDLIWALYYFSTGITQNYCCRSITRRTPKRQGTSHFQKTTATLPMINLHDHFPWSLPTITYHDATPQSAKEDCIKKRTHRFPQCSAPTYAQSTL